MPGPFSSESYRGTFDNDISKIKQNEILSSKTFNNFVRSLYNLFYTDDVYRNVYKSSGQEASSIIMTEANAHGNVQGPGWNSSEPDAHPVNHEMATTYLWIKNVDNSYDPAAYSTSPEGHLCIAPVSSDTDVLNDDNLNELAYEASLSPEHLFYGTGDVSVSVKPYALFRTAVDSNSYCCITYLYGEHTGDDVSGYSEGTYTPKYSSMAEIVFIYDPTIDSGDTAIRKVWGMSGSAITDEGGLPTGEAYTRLTIIYGSAVTLAHLKAFLDSLTFQAEGSSTETQNVFKTVFVGDVDQNIFLYQLFAYLEDMKNPNAEPKDSLEDYTRDDTRAFTRVTRFVPVRSSIKISNPSVFWENLTASTEPDSDPGYLVVDPRAITAYVGKYSVIDTEQTDDSDQAGRLRFTHTGVYGFIINNTLNSNNMEVYTDGQPARFIYIPNKEHYENNHYVPGTDSTIIPDWAASNGDGGLPNEIERALTTDFDANYFFLPLITVTDTMLLFAGGGVISLRDAVFNGNTVISIPADGSGTNLESGIIYDAWNHPDRCNDNLVKEANLIYGKVRKGLQGIYRKDDTEASNEPELIDLESYDPKPVNSLVRTLQMATGCTWNLNNIVWIDPRLKHNTPDSESEIDESSPALKMFSGYQAIFDYENNYSGQGSILNSNTVVVYLSYSSEDSSAQVELCADQVLPAGLTHIGLMVPAQNEYDHPDRFPVTKPNFHSGLGTTTTVGNVTFTLKGYGMDYFNNGWSFSDQDFCRVNELKFKRAAGEEPLHFLGFHNCKINGLVCSKGTTDTVLLSDSTSIAGDLLSGYLSEVSQSEIYAARLVLENVTSVMHETWVATPAYHADTLPELVQLSSLNHSKLDLAFKFIDNRDNAWVDARNLSEITSLINIGGELKNSDITLRIIDGGTSWIAPGADQSMPWQAFDPEICLPGREGVTFPNTFLFIDCGLQSQSARGRFINCNLTVNLSNDFTRYEPKSTYSGPNKTFRFYERKDKRFFASRFFRRSPYVFYFGDRHPYYYIVQASGRAVDATVKRSYDVNLNITVGPDADSFAVISELYYASGSFYPVLPIPGGPDSDIAEEVPKLFTYKVNHIFISGLDNSKISLDNMFVPGVNKRAYTTLNPTTKQRTYPTVRTKQGADVLFEAVANSTITMSGLNTTYPLQDEWEYESVAGYDKPCVWWCEPERGFLFFTYPRFMADSSNHDLQLNRNNTLYVANWTTRKLLSGIHGLCDSRVDIHYTFTTQGRDLKDDPQHLIFDWGALRYKGPIRWGMDLADPGAMHRHNWLGIDDDPDQQERGVRTVYLPVAPLFYLADVCSSKINLVPSTCGLNNINPLGGTMNVDRIGFSMRHQYRNTESYLPSVKPALHENAVRPLRVAVGYLLTTEWNQSEAAVIFPSSYNNLSGTFTRANMVAGVMNKVTGWCYRLFSTNIMDFIPEKFHPTSTERPTYSDIFYPPIGGVAGYHDRYDSNNEGLLDREDIPDSIAVNEIDLIGTLQRAAVTKELSFDCSAAALTLEEENAMLQALSFLHADYPIYSVGDFGKTLDNPNAVFYTNNHEIGLTGYKLGYPGCYQYCTYNGDTGELETIGEEQGKPSEDIKVGYAGAIPGPTIREFIATGTSTNYTLWGDPSATVAYESKMSIVNATNVANLDVLLVATSSIFYFKKDTGVKSSADLAGINYQILEGELIHTVYTQGWRLRLERFFR